MICQRCHETIREDDRYCHVCGLPQLLYVAPDVPAAPYGRDAEPDSESTFPSADGSSSGTSLRIAGKPAGSGLDAIGSAAGIVWRPALRAAMIFSVPAAILCAGLTPLGLICMAVAAAWAVSMYSKRTRVSLLSTATGARIGLITGIMASWLTLAIVGASLWMTRFILHQGGEIDSLLTKRTMASFDLSQQLIAQLGMATAESTQLALARRAWMLSADGRAGTAFSELMTAAVFLMIFGTLGGAVGARFFKPSRKHGT